MAVSESEAQLLDGWPAPCDQFQINVDSRQARQATDLRQTTSGGRFRIHFVDGKAVFRRELIEQLLDGAAASTMCGEQQHTHDNDLP